MDRLSALVIVMGSCRRRLGHDPAAQFPDHGTDAGGPLRVVSSRRSADVGAGTPRAGDVRCWVAVWLARYQRASAAIGCRRPRRVVVKREAHDRVAEWVRERDCLAAKRLELGPYWPATVTLGYLSANRAGFFATTTNPPAGIVAPGGNVKSIPAVKRRL